MAASDHTDEFATPFDEDEYVISPTLEMGAVDVCQPFPPTSDRPQTFDPNWRTETVVALASGIHIDAAYDRLPILADALEEAGCDHPQLLHHCRTCPHPFACCWVVNVILHRVPDALPTPVPHPVHIPADPAPGPRPRPRTAATINRFRGWVFVACGVVTVIVLLGVLRLMTDGPDKPRAVPAATSSAGW